MNLYLLQCSVPVENYMSDIQFATKWFEKALPIVSVLLISVLIGLSSTLIICSCECLSFEIDGVYRLTPAKFLCDYKSAEIRDTVVMYYHCLVKNCSLNTLISSSNSTGNSIWNGYGMSFSKTIIGFDQLKPNDTKMGPSECRSHAREM